MVPRKPHATVNFKTLDGVTLEAWLWEVDGPAPAIVMTHGVSEKAPYRETLMLSNF
jgi:dipeptidyl aminopeptidase/acylaminoacyl peptidase